MSNYCYNRGDATLATSPRELRINFETFRFKRSLGRPAPKLNTAATEFARFSPLYNIPRFYKPHASRDGRFTFLARSAFLKLHLRSPYYRSKMAITLPNGSLNQPISGPWPEAFPWLIPL